jgi:uncharacterized membrane protein
MKKNLLPVFVLLLLTAAYAAWIAHGTAQLPDRVAIHFGADGRANGWAHRTQAAQIFETLVIVPVILLALALVMRVMPTGAFNLPHRDYWLAPERRKETVAAISGQLIWMDCLLVAFLAGIYQLTIEANRLAPPHLPMNLFLALVIGFILATILWTILFLRRFFNVPAAPRT